MQTLLQDLRYGARMLWKRPGFTLISALTLSLGIGANTAIFSLIDAMLLRMLPVKNPERLALFGSCESQGISIGFPDGRSELFSYPFYRDVRQRNQVFTDVAAIQSLPNNVYGVVSGSEGDPEMINARLVSGSYFSVLGVEAVLGRAFTDADDQIPGDRQNHHYRLDRLHAYWRGAKRILRHGGRRVAGHLDPAGDGGTGSARLERA